MPKALAVFSFTWNGIPMIYSGQELPNTKRLKFFEKDTIEWKDECTLYEFYKSLLALRKNNPALTAGDSTVTTRFLKTNVDNNVLVYLRKKDMRTVLVLLNLSGDILHCVIDDGQLPGSFTDVFSKRTENISEHKVFELSPWEYRVYEN
jgi:alpha-amylase